MLVDYGADDFVPTYEYGARSYGINDPCVELYDTVLTLTSVVFIDEEAINRDEVISVTVTLCGYDKCTATIHSCDRPPYALSMTPNTSFAPPSSTPFRIFVVELDADDQFEDTPVLWWDFNIKTYMLKHAHELLSDECHAPIVKGILYRVPSRLVDFIKLPLTQPYTRKMVLCVWVLAQHRIPPDIVGVVVVLAVQLHYEFDYAQYCEHQLTKC